MTHSRNTVIRYTLLCCALAIAAPAFALDYPARTVRIIVPYPPGGTPDILGRLLAGRFTERLGKPFVVENRAGASGIIGSQAVLGSPPDGYTLMMGSVQTHGMNPNTFRKPPYDAINGFSPISEIAQTPNVLVVNPSFPAKSVRDLLDMARQKPGTLNFGSTSTGGTPHLSGELLKIKTGIEITHVPYKGSGPMLSDLIAGHVPMAFDNLPASMSQIRSGALRALAVTTIRRSPAAPDIPTFEEAGVKDFDVSSWFGVFAPAKVPPEIINLLHREIVGILQEPAMRARLLELGATPVGSTPAEFAIRIKAEIAKWGDIVRASRLELQ